MKTLSDLLPAAAARDPEGAAVRNTGVSTTWAEAATAAGRIGDRLVGAGVSPGDRVGLLHRKSTEGFLAVHGVVQQGAVAVPLDPSAAPGYLNSIIDETGCRVVVTHEACRTTAARLRADRHDGLTVLDLDLDPSADPADPVVVAPDAPAYLITTSGSTGRPKSICHTHESALAYISAVRAAYDYTPDDRIGDIAPNHFDISTQALWVTPAVGATNIVVPEPYQMLPASLSQLMADERMTVWYGVPFLLTQLLTRGAVEDRDLSALRWVLFGGEPLNPRHLAELMELLPGARFSNVYGPAEVNACTVHHLDAPPTGSDPVPIGRPMADVEIKLVPADGDDHDRGEIWVQAPTMMTGYWQRPDLDEHAIVETGDGRWYRTGDLAHTRPDGTLVFTGRVDHQVKVRGYRIELEAVEAVLEEQPDVAHAVAAVARTPQGEDVVIAGIVGPADLQVDPESFRATFSERLPTYAHPVALLRIDSQPTTGSGKLDRRGIRSQLVRRFEHGTDQSEGSVQRV